MKNRFQILLVTLILFLCCCGTAFSDTTIPEFFYAPPKALWTPSDFTWPDEPYYTKYPDGAPYSLVAQGSQEDWDTWDVADKGILELIGLGKMDSDTGSIEGSLDAFDIQPDPINGVQKGSWTYIGGTDSIDWIEDDTDEFELYFSIKAGNVNSGAGYNLFVMNDKWYADDDLHQAVTWSTLENFLVDEAGIGIGLDGKDISHIAFWKGPALPGTPETPIPEPATMLLFGFGLIGLARIGRTRKMKLP